MRFTSAAAVCVATILVTCDAARADQPERVDVVRAECPDYVPPKTFDFVQWDRVGPRDPCYLRELKTLLAFLAATTDEDDTEVVRNRLAELYAQVGDERASRRTIEVGDALADVPPSGQRAPHDRYRATDAVSYIAHKAAAHQLVILNEDHAAPRHREFARRLLKPLRALGYTHFAAEAFERDPEAFARSISGGVPTFASGTYVRDPAFGRLMREAIALGFELVPYEAFEPVNGPAPNGGFAYHVYRETSQAKNLHARVFAKTPSAKLFVYAGFSHVVEEPVRRTSGRGLAKWMAAELKVLAGTDPLSIDQVTLTPALDARWDDADYHTIAPLLLGSEPTVVLDGDVPADLGIHGSKIDIVVAHPRLGDAKGRPGWVFRDSEFKRVSAAAPAPGLMQLRLRGEASDAVPFDQMLVERAGPVLLLAPRDRNAAAVFVPWN